MGVVRDFVDAAVRGRGEQPVLYTLEHGKVISKQRALQWAAETLPAEWRALIDQVRKDRFVRWNDPPPPGSVDCTLAFVGYVQERARSSNCRPPALG